MSDVKELKGAMLLDLLPNSLLYRGQCLNLDTCFTPGIFDTVAQSTCENPPEGWGVHWQYGMLEVLKRNSTVEQRLSSSAKGIVVRFGNSATGVWGDWRVICT